MKLRSFLILLLSAGMIILGAMLPEMAGRWQDASENQRVSYAQVSEIHLQLGEDSGELGMTAKLSILTGYARALELPESMATLTSKELLDIAQNVILQYQSAGLIPYDTGISVSSKNISSQAFLVYWDTERTWSNVFWNVYVQFSEGSSLELIIDDETGTVCTVNFGDNQDPSSTDGYIYDVSGALTELCTLYLDGLGEEFDRYDPAGIASKGRFVETYEGDEDKTSITTEISWSDIIFGEATIHFAVTPHGFYNVIY